MISGDATEPQPSSEQHPDGGGQTAGDAHARSLSDIDSALRMLGSDLDIALEKGAARCGKFTLLHEIGEGGYGEVYAAVEDPPAARRVAVKILKRGMDTRDILRRFALEQRSLARIDHPNVAPILDAGLSPDGRPWFAMPLLEGDPIDIACDTLRLGLVERVQALAAACDGVQAAHVQGIVHRDIKPGNIMLESLGAGMVAPRVIDFGIAKALDSDDAPTRTLDAGRLGTPEFMAPEQLEAERPWADTRSDVYALGVVLSRLLTGIRPTAASPRPGGTPHDRPLPSRQVAEERNRTREEAERHARVLGFPSTDALARRLRGDLDAIVLKATAHDPERRYQTAEALATDLRRWVAGHPVSARVPGTAERLTGFARRHRLLVTASAVALSIVGATTLFALAQAAEARAQQLRAELQARRSARVVESLRMVFTGVEASVERGSDRRLMAEILEAASSRLEAEDAGFDPIAAADLAAVLGDTYVKLDMPERAREIVEQAIAKLEAAELPEDRETGRDSARSQGRLHAVRGDAIARTAMMSGGAFSQAAGGAEAIAAWKDALRKFDEAGAEDDLSAIRCTIQLWSRELVWPEGAHHRTLGDELARAVDRLDDSEQIKWAFFTRRAELNNFVDLLAEYPPALTRASAALGARHPMVLEARSRLIGFRLGAAIESCIERKVGVPDYSEPERRQIWEESMREGERLETDLAAVLGPDHRLTLTTRLWTAIATGHLQGAEAARPLFESLRNDLRRTQGQDSLLAGQLEAAWKGVTDGPRFGKWW